MYVYSHVPEKKGKEWVFRRTVHEKDVNGHK